MYNLNMSQLKRIFAGDTYYCEKITTNYNEAKQKKNNAKAAGMKARIIELFQSGRKTYGVYISPF